MSKYFALALVIIAFLFGTGVGYWLSPQYDAMSTETTMTDLGKADKNLDLRYIDGMIAHHKSAIHLAEQAKTASKRKEITDLAAAIIKADTADIDKLYQLKQKWYGNKRQVKEFEQVNLGKYDENFDLRFLNALLDHHEEGIMVAQEVRTKSTRNETLNIADSAILSLSKSKVQLEQWRKDWYSAHVTN